jgi:hypothetical protein
MNAETINKTDWSKIAMGIAVAVVFIMQQYHSMKLDDMKAKIVPRTEYQQNADTILPKDEIMFALKNIATRLETLEKEHKKVKDQ